MAKVDFFSSPVALSLADLYAIDDELEPTLATADTFVVGGQRGDFVKFVYSGEDFEYSQTGVTGGTLETLQVFYSKSANGKFVEIQRTTDLDVDFAAFARTSDIANPEKAAAAGAKLLYGGDDTVRGGSTADIFTPVGGDDTVKAGGGDDTIDGGSGDDYLSGGSGKDVITGGGGADLFVFDSKLDKSRDTITDFNVKADTFGLDDRIFREAGLSGDLTKSEFYVGSKAHDADDRIIYDKASGKLFYDADGDGDGKAKQFATLDDGLKLTFKDFDMV